MKAEQQTAQHGHNNTNKKSVLMIGLDPSQIDFSSPDFAAFPRLSAEKMWAGMRSAEEHLNTLGHDVQHCLIDDGETAATVVTAKLENGRFDCILIGAGVRAVASNLILFEKLVNTVHELTPHSRICFNSSPSDTLEALQRLT